jgi:hypothetical protein
MLMLDRRMLLRAGSAELFKVIADEKDGRIPARSLGSVSMFLPANTPRLRQRSELSRNASMPCIVQAKKAAGLSRSLALVPSSPLP